MKKLLLALMVFAVAITGCKKMENTPPANSSSGDGEIVFAGQTVESNGLKSGQDADELAEYALITIRDANNDETTYTRDVYYIGAKAYTQSIKLPDGDYTLVTFLLMDNFNTPSDSTDDVEIFAIPMQNSDYASFVSTTTEFPFVVEAFKKIEIPVEVLRFEGSDYESFGFDWFVIEQSVIYQHCFFGDLCVKNPDDYLGSNYELQSTGLQMDMPAIAKIEVYQKREDWAEFLFTGSFTNNIDTMDYGVGEPLCINFEDYTLYTDEYQLKLYILVADGEGFGYKHFLTWEFTDENAMTVLNPGTDNVTDFVLGTCVPDADFIIPPYMNLPETVTYKGLSPHAPGNLGGYVDAQLTDVGDGYEIHDGTYASWCFDWSETINLNQPYHMNVYSSLYPDLMPAYLAEKEWDKANWLMNHLHWYDGYAWNDIQGALWLLDNWNGTPPGGSGMTGLTMLAQQMFDDATEFGEGYLPLPGGWAAVIFAKDSQIQTVFIVVDP